jgi:hypothetical protein
MLGAVGVEVLAAGDKTACLDGEAGDDSDAVALVDGLDNRGLRAGHGSQTASPARTGQDDSSTAEGGVPVEPARRPLRTTCERTVRRCADDRNAERSGHEPRGGSDSSWSSWLLHKAAVVGRD